MLVNLHIKQDYGEKVNREAYAMKAASKYCLYVRVGNNYEVYEVYVCLCPPWLQ